MSLIIPEWIGDFYNWTDEAQSSWTDQGAFGFEAVVRGFFWLAHKVLFFGLFPLVIVFLEIEYYPSLPIATGIFVIAVEVFHFIGRRR